MNKIHLEKKSAEELKRNIDECIGHPWVAYRSSRASRIQSNIKRKADLIIHKMYVPLSICMFKETQLAPDMVTLISEYINDLILLEYETKTDMQHDIIIKTKDVIINDIVYNFSYSFD